MKRVLGSIAIMCLFIACAATDPVCRHNVTTQFALQAEQRPQGDTRIVILDWWDVPGQQVSVQEPLHAMVQVCEDGKWLYVDETSGDVIRWSALEPPGEIVAEYYSLAEYERGVLVTQAE